MTVMDKQKLRESFDQYDRDKNGSIDFAEFKELLSALDDAMDDDSRRLAFGTIDEDSSGTIQFEEFCDWWQQH